MSIVRQLGLVVAAGSLGLGALVINAQSTADWPAAAGDVGGMKYSPADQITPANDTSK